MKSANILLMTEQLSIALVEDDAEVGTWTRDKLDQLDNIASFRWVTNLADAKKLLEHWLPDVIILDLNLPDGNGIDLIKYIRKEKLRVKIVVFSINKMMKNACLRMGATAFYDKSGGSEALISDLAKGEF